MVFNPVIHSQNTTDVIIYNTTQHEKRFKSTFLLHYDKDVTIKKSRIHVDFLQVDFQKRNKKTVLYFSEENGCAATIFRIYYLGMLWILEKQLLLHNEWARFHLFCVHCEKPKLLRSEVMPQRAQAAARVDRMTAGWPARNTSIFNHLDDARDLALSSTLTHSFILSSGAEDKANKVTIERQIKLIFFIFILSGLQLSPEVSHPKFWEEFERERDL